MKASLYIRSMGKALKVEALYQDTPEGALSANKRMASEDQLAVVAVLDGFIFLASKWDKGVKIDDAVNRKAVQL